MKTSISSRPYQSTSPPQAKSKSLIGQPASLTACLYSPRVCSLASAGRPAGWPRRTAPGQSGYHQPSQPTGQPSSGYLGNASLHIAAHSRSLGWGAWRVPGPWPQEYRKCISQVCISQVLNPSCLSCPYPLASSAGLLLPNPPALQLALRLWAGSPPLGFALEAPLVLPCARAPARSKSASVVCVGVV